MRESSTGREVWINVTSDAHFLNSGGKASAKTDANAAEKYPCVQKYPCAPIPVATAADSKETMNKVLCIFLHTPYQRILISPKDTFYAKLPDFALSGGF